MMRVHPGSMLSKMFNQHDLCLLPAGLIKCDGIAVASGREPERHTVEHAQIGHAMLGEIKKADDRVSVSRRPCEHDFLIHNCKLTA
jgi:hypothetical protein